MTDPRAMRADLRFHFTTDRSRAFAAGSAPGLPSVSFGTTVDAMSDEAMEYAAGSSGSDALGFAPASLIDEVVNTVNGCTRRRPKEACERPPCARTLIDRGTLPPWW